jgi:phosphatidylinositol 4-kinase
MWSCSKVAMPNIGGWQADSSNLLASQFAAKNYYSGELSGARFVLDSGKHYLERIQGPSSLSRTIYSGLENLEKLAPNSSSTDQLAAFRQQMAEAMANIETKSQTMPVPAIRRLLLRAVSVLTSSPIVSIPELPPISRSCSQS